MGIFTDAKDIITVRKLIRNKKSNIVLGDLSNFSRAQLDKLVTMSPYGVYVDSVMFNTTNQIEKYLQLGKICNNMDGVANILMEIPQERMCSIFDNKPVDELEQEIYNEYLNIFFSNKKYINIKYFSDNFKEAHRNIFFLDLTSDFCDKAYRRNLSIDDVISNIGVLENISEIYNVGAFIGEADAFKKMVEKIGLKEIKNIVNNIGIGEFKDFFLNREKVREVERINDNSKDYLKDITNYIYGTMDYFWHTDFTGYEYVDIIGKKRILDFLSDNYFDGLIEKKVFVFEIYDYLIREIGLPFDDKKIVELLDVYNKRKIINCFNNEIYSQISQLVKGNKKKINTILACFVFEYHKSGKDAISIAKEFLDEVNNIPSSKMSFFTFNILKSINYKESQYFEMIMDNFAQLGLNYNYLFENDAIDMRVFESRIINLFGVNLLNDILIYYKSGVLSCFNDIISNLQDTLKLKNILTYFEGQNLMNTQMLLDVILHFKKCEKLFDDLLKNNVQLGENNVNCLLEIFKNDNKYNVSSYNELLNYINYKVEKNKVQFSSSIVDEVRTAVLETLFGITFDEAKEFLMNFTNRKWFKINYEDNNLIPIDIIACIRIMENIYNFQGNSEELRKKYYEIFKLGPIKSYVELLDSIKKCNSLLWKKSLFVTTPDKKCSFIKGVSSHICTKDIYNNPITCDDDIKIVNLDEEPFNILIHGVHKTGGWDPKFKSVGIKLYNNPSIWNNTAGSTTISTSYISNRHLATAFNDAVYYGFTDIPDEAVKIVSTCDAAIVHGGGQREVVSGRDNSSLLNTPEGVIANSWEGVYNEVGLMRTSDKLKKTFGGRIQPTCIISFSKNISEQSKLAAQYFRVPIYIINSQKYYYSNTNSQKYLEGNIVSFGRIDIDNIVLAPINDKTNKSNLCIRLCKWALTMGLVNYTEYYDLLIYLRYSLVKTCKEIDLESLKEINYLIEEAKRSIDFERIGEQISEREK